MIVSIQHRPSTCSHLSNFVDSRLNVLKRETPLLSQSPPLPGGFEGVVDDEEAAEDVVYEDVAAPQRRGLHSSTSQLIVSTFCGLQRCTPPSFGLS